MESRGISRRRRFSRNDQKALAICMSVLAILSPLYVDRRSLPETQLEEQSINLYLYLPVFLLLLIMAISLSGYFDQSFTSFDPYWIHRVGGSSTGILIVLVFLGLVLRCKSF